MNGSIPHNFGDYVKMLAINPNQARCANPLLDPVAAYRAYLEQEEQFNRYWGEYWDSGVIDGTDAASVAIKFFQKPLGTDGKTIQETNFIGAAIFPNKNAMIVHHVGMRITPIETADPLTDWTDFLLVTQNCYCNLKSNQKLLGEWLGDRIPWGGGPYSFSGFGSTLTANTLQNGFPTKAAQTKLWVPIVFSPMEQIEGNFLMDPVAFATMVDTHPTAKVYITFVMEGEIFNKIS